MGNMIIEKQLNIPDRTLLAGKMNGAIEGEYATIGTDRFRIIGLSCGVTPPYISVEIEPTKTDLIGKMMTA